MTTVYDINSPYKIDSGLNFREYFGTFDSYTGDDIWINYELSMNNTGVQVVCLYAQPNPSLLFGSAITNKRLLTYNGGFEDEESYRMTYYDGTSYARMAGGDISSNSPYLINGINYINKGFYKYNAHIYQNKIDFYINNNYYTTKTIVTKYFCIIIKGSSRHTILLNSNNYLKYITLTDKMSNVIPKPPYTLDEKNNEIYGYKN